MLAPRKVIILGTGGNAIDILDTLQEVTARGGQNFDCLGFLDDNPQLWHKELSGAPVLGPIDSASTFADAWFVNGIGSPQSFLHKEAIIGKAGVPHDRFLSLVHPTASVSKFARLEAGAVVLQNATIASHATLGKHVIVLPNSVVSHDSTIGDYSCLAAGVCVSGGVTVGKSCYLGTNCSIMNGLTLGDECLVGMGSVVLRPVSANSVVVGNPARLLRSTRSGNT